MSNASNGLYLNKVTRESERCRTDEFNSTGILFIIKYIGIMTRAAAFRQYALARAKSPFAKVARSDPPARIDPTRQANIAGPKRSKNHTRYYWHKGHRYELQITCERIAAGGSPDGRGNGASAFDSKPGLMDSPARPPAMPCALTTVC